MWAVLLCVGDLNVIDALLANLGFQVTIDSQFFSCRRGAFATVSLKPNGMLGRVELLAPDSNAGDAKVAIEFLDRIQECLILVGEEKMGCVLCMKSEALWDIHVSPAQETRPR
jgi:hypothetical protein